ncbi:Protoheme IX farnesyltransferase, mitochondrial [Tolypocladium ophioglossoides CBS 100239]|uniref:Protoheme IX farnesyltransferase, mitochondrial n=1 Tax=Tolypocladium ophioglossoides (strain CBS 100239) TaxID=1163406 RepID=A0A0L0NIC3_TOLOC|nr:Protoheme IX farnesyltransferase, mitochondrial [Tolypocladium ophioglossoides CBS 100239]
MRPPRILARAAELRCLAQGPRPRSAARWLSSAASLQAPRSAAVSPLASAGFFLSNRLFERSNCLEPLVASHKPRATSTSTVTSVAAASTAALSETPQPLADVPPHRRRQARRQAAGSSESPDATLPANASSTLTTVAAAQPAHSFRRILSTLLSLSKPRLTVLVVLTAMAPYALYPVPEMLTPTMTETPSLSPLTLLFLTTGTALCSASANALNMLYEPSTDAKMTRTRNRPLVRKLISTRAAALFAILAGATGVGALYFGVNRTVSFLGLSNIVLYAGIYTPLKAVTALNTWIGAVVGGLPPLMGWAAAAGETATNDGSWRELLFASDGSSIGGWLLASLLFAWQFPHFMALSWGIREEYKAAGLRMLAWTNPARNARVALRYSLVFIPSCLSLCAAGVTEWSFAATSLPINLWLAREAVRFWKYEGHKGSARGLFWASVWHLPGVMILALLHKKGLWSRAWRSVFGDEHDEGEGEWEEDEELEEMASMAAEVVSTAAPAAPARS